MPKGHPLPANPTSKTCMDCGLSYPLANFHANKEYSDGRIPRCKSCQGIYVKTMWTLVPDKKKAYEKRRYAASREKALRRLKEIHAMRKLMVLCHYGGDPPYCSCCGEDCYVFLSLDHINNDGAAHRRAVGNSQAIYRWILKNDYPSGFQVLCFNCNLAKQFSGKGKCPHQEEMQ